MHTITLEPGDALFKRYGRDIPTGSSDIDMSNLEIAYITLKQNIQNLRKQLEIGRENVRGTDNPEYRKYLLEQYFTNSGVLIHDISQKSALLEMLQLAKDYFYEGGRRDTVLAWRALLLME